MATQSPSNRAALRTFVVLLLAAIVLAMFLPDVRRAWQPTGDLGFGLDADHVFNFVDPNAAAARAGLKVGDQLDMKVEFFRAPEKLPQDWSPACSKARAKGRAGLTCFAESHDQSPSQKASQRTIITPEAAIIA